VERRKREKKNGKKGCLGVPLSMTAQRGGGNLIREKGVGIPPERKRSPECLKKWDCALPEKGGIENNAEGRTQREDKKSLGGKELFRRKKRVPTQSTEGGGKVQLRRGERCSGGKRHSRRQDRDIGQKKESTFRRKKHPGGKKRISNQKEEKVEMTYPAKGERLSLTEGKKIKLGEGGEGKSVRIGPEKSYPFERHSEFDRKMEHLRGRGGGGFERGRRDGFGGVSGRKNARQGGGGTFDARGEGGDFADE